MAKSKQPKNLVAAPPKGVPKENNNDDFVQPQDLNFSNLSAKIRAQFQSFEDDRKKRSQQNHKPQKVKNDKSGNVEQSKIKQVRSHLVSPHPEGRNEGTMARF